VDDFVQYPAFGAANWRGVDATRTPDSIASFAGLDEDGAAMPNEEEVGANLKVCFGEGIALEKGYADWCRVGSFLSEPDRVLPHMATLDSDMYKRFCKRAPSLGIDRVNDRVMVTQAYSNYYGSYKPGAERPVVKDVKLTAKTIEVDRTLVGSLLSQTLTRFEEKHGFHFETGDLQANATITVADRTTAPKVAPRVATYHGFVEATNFNKQLTKRSHWKDPGALLIHGEFTHRIQWYAIVRGLLPNGNDAADVFESIGQYTGTFARPEGGKLYLWDALCDRTNKKDVSFENDEFKTFDAPGRGKDFRSPENLNFYLMEREGEIAARWPLLRDFLKARYLKRSSGVGQAAEDARMYLGDEDAWERAFQCQYLCRKLYDCSYWTLAPTDSKRLKIDALMQKPSDMIWMF